MAGSWGDKWLRALIEKSENDCLETSQAEQERVKKEAQKVIRSLPKKIEEAMRTGERIVFAFRFINYTEVSGDASDKVDMLYESLKRSGRLLAAKDLIGRAGLVFDWCDSHDLECFLTPEKVHMSGTEYIFCVRPKGKKE